MSGWLSGAWLLAEVEPQHLFRHLQVLVHMCIHTMGDSELTRCFPYLPGAGTQNPSGKQHLSTILFNAASILDASVVAQCLEKGEKKFQMAALNIPRMETIFFPPLKTEAAGIIQLLVMGVLITENSSVLAVKFFLLSTLTITGW